MRYPSLLLLLTSFSFLVPACAQKSTAPQAKAPKALKASRRPVASAGAKPASEAGPVLTFERTPCFGTCPAYSMKVFADGRVAYEGRRGVTMMGAQELRLPSATVASLLRQAKEAGFERFQERYSQNTSDLPSTIIGIKQADGTLKTVTVEEGAPENVRTLFTNFGQQFDQLAQLNGLEK